MQIAHTNTYNLQFTQDEEVRMLNMMLAYSHLDGPLNPVSVVAMCSGQQAVRLEADHFQNKRPIWFGSDQIHIRGYGNRLEEVLPRWVAEYYSRGSDALQKTILLAACLEAVALGDSASRMTPEGLTINHRILLAAEEGRLGVYRKE